MNFEPAARLRCLAKIRAAAKIRPTSARRTRSGLLPLLLAPLLVLPLALAGCMQADTRGQEAPDSVQIVGTPTWDNGIAALMDLKCAVCHRLPLPDIAPNATPTDLSLHQYTLIGTTRGAQDIQLSVLAGIAQQNVAAFSRMPPDYGTPLTAGETAALLTWAAANPLPDVAGGLTPADGLVLYAAYCQNCHGVHGAGGPYINIQGTDPVAIQAAIDIGIASVPLMSAWPNLPALVTAQRQAIANYLASP